MPSWLKTFVFAAGIVLLGGVASAQGPLQAPAAKALEKDLCAVSGLVVRVITNEPLKRANVSLRRIDSPGEEPTYGAQTDISGRFSIEGIPPGRYHMEVSRAGYLTQTYGQESGAGPGAVLALDPGRKVDGLLFRMAPWAVIAGRITNEDGEPLARVQVQAMRSQFHEGKRSLMSAGGFQTNDLGEYRLFGLRPGHYYIQAVYADWRNSATVRARPGNRVQAPTSDYAPIFYPGTSEIARAVATDVRAGQEVPSVDFAMTPVPVVKVRGHVADTLNPKQPVESWVMLRPAEGFFYGQRNQAQVEKATGAFEINGVVPGAYQIVASSSEGNRQHSTQKRIDVGNTDLEGVELTITRGVEVHGRLTLEGNARVELAGLQVVLSAPDANPYLSVGASEQVNADGTFTLTEVSEGAYQLRVYGRHEGWYLKSVVQNGQDALTNGVTVSSGGGRGLVEVALGTAGGQVDGVVTDSDGLPIPGATIALVPEGEWRKLYDFYRDGSTDQNGRFIFRDIRPGSYKLFSWREVEQNSWQDPDVLKPIEDKGVKVSVDENGHLTVELKPISSAATASAQ
jgi:protocatechuate 3,4-dioxygenase beta subunit